MERIVSRTMTDRFWQAGISPGSKDEFYAKVTGTKVTLEGFASSVRGAIRAIREMCYSILFCMSRLDVHFYGFEELPGPLADALFANAKSLSSHQLSTMLSMVRYLVDDCPVALREQFLPPILSRLFTELDRKVDAEWDELGRRAQASSEDDNLTNEMKEESILRQLTNSSVLMVAGLLDPQRESESHGTSVSLSFLLTSPKTHQIHLRPSHQTLPLAREAYPGTHYSRITPRRNRTRCGLLCSHRCPSCSR